jgi:hypothetical protein
MLTTLHNCTRECPAIEIGIKEVKTPQNDRTGNRRGLRVLCHAKAAKLRERNWGTA